MKKFIFCIDANIGAGKSTLINNLQKNGKNVFPEPVHTWKPYLDLFYSDMKRWGFLLELTILDYFADLYKRCPEFSIIERSHITTKEIFIDNLYHDKMINKEEYEFLVKYWNKIYSPKIFNIYIDVPADECLKRIQNRNRPFEKNITIDYLQSLEKSYKKKYNTNSFTVDGSKSPKEVCNMVEIYINNIITTIQS